MSPIKANEILDKFPELISLIEKLRLSDRNYKDIVLMAVISAISDKDGEILAVVDRLEHFVNKEVRNAPNALSILAALSRLRYKLNVFMDNEKYILEK